MAVRRSRSSAARRWLALTGAAIAVGACLGDPPPPRAGEGEGGTAAAQSPPGAELVDSTIPPAVAGEEGWNYRQAADADLDGDGEPEKVVLTARVELHQGRPAWDDGQPWQVYVEEPDGARTYLYARRLQLGTLTMRVGRPAEGSPATVVLLEHLPDRMAVHEAAYAGPGRVSVETRFERELDPRGETASPRLP